MVVCIVSFVVAAALLTKTLILKSVRQSRLSDLNSTVLLPTHNIQTITNAGNLAIRSRWAL
jgi:hypothetical protein